jgi:hypothetical protein
MEVYIPTHRDETAMDGAPEFLVVIEENSKDNDGAVWGDSTIRGWRRDLSSIVS